MRIVALSVPLLSAHLFLRAGDRYWTSEHRRDMGTLQQGLDSYVHRPTSGEAGVEFGPIVFVSALWSRVGSVRPLRTDPRQKTRCDD